MDERRLGWMKGGGSGNKKKVENGTHRDFFNFLLDDM